MIASIVIIAFSVVMFVYWFRYTCVLILNAKTTKDYAGQVAMANQLSFLDVSSQLCAPSPDLTRLHQSLDRDFQVITFLLRHASGVEVRGFTLEERMLMIDYNIMKMWYGITHGRSANQARVALDEMANIVGHFANSVGERATCAVRI